VTRLRQALSDSAETPRYIQTVARRATASSGPSRPPSWPRPSRPPRRSARDGSTSRSPRFPSWRWPADNEWKVVPLTTDLGSEVHANFSPDASQITYEWRKEDGTPHIYVKLFGPGDAIRLTSSDLPEFGPA